MTITPIPACVDQARRVLIDVYPPYPPLGLEDDPTEPDVGLPVVLGLLDEAARAATSIPERCRYGEVLVLLRRAPSARPQGVRR